MSSATGRRAVTGLAVAIVATMLSGGVVAAVAATGSHTINACADKSSGALRLAKHCRSGERAVSWNSVGPRGPAGNPATKLFASVEADGTVDSGTSGVTAFDSASFPGLYAVDFHRDITHCTGVANVGQVPVFSSSGASTGRAVALALVDQSSAGGYLDYPGTQFPSADSLSVEVYDLSGNLTQSSFHVAVFC